MRKVQSGEHRDLLRLFWQITLRICCQTNFSPFFCFVLYCEAVTPTKIQFPASKPADFQLGSATERHLQAWRTGEREKSENFSPLFPERASLTGESFHRVGQVRGRLPLGVSGSSLSLCPSTLKILVTFYYCYLCFCCPLFGFSGFLAPVKTITWVKFIPS